MSAFLVEPKLIGLLSAFAVTNKLTEYGIMARKGITTTKQVANCLAQANIDSVNHRYPQHIDDNSTREDKLYIDDCIISASAVHAHANIGVIAKHADCLDYQSCEIDSWYESNAYKILTVIRCELLSKLDGYDDAKWGSA